MICLTFYLSYSRPVVHAARRTTLIERVKGRCRETRREAAREPRRESLGAWRGVGAAGGTKVLNAYFETRVQRVWKPVGFRVCGVVRDDSGVLAGASGLMQLPVSGGEEGCRSKVFWGAGGACSISFIWETHVVLFCQKDSPWEWRGPQAKPGSNTGRVSWHPYPQKRAPCCSLLVCKLTGPGSEFQAQVCKATPPFFIFPLLLDSTSSPPPPARDTGSFPTVGHSSLNGVWPECRGDTFHPPFLQLRWPLKFLLLLGTQGSYQGRALPCHAATSPEQELEARLGRFQRTTDPSFYFSGGPCFPAGSFSDAMVLPHPQTPGIIVPVGLGFPKGKEEPQISGREAIHPLEMRKREKTIVTNP